MVRLRRSWMSWARVCSTMAVAATTLACGSGDEHDSAEPKGSATETAPPSPEQAFLDQLDDEGVLGPSDDPGQVLDIAQTLCDDLEEGLARLEEAQALDASPDTDTLVSLAELALQSSLGRAAREFPDSATERAVMSAAADHLCSGPSGEFIDEYVILGPASLPPPTLPTIPPPATVTPSP